MQSYGSARDRKRVTSQVGNSNVVDLSLEQIATSTLHQFSQQTPKQAITPNRFHQSTNKKVQRLSTWHNDSDGNKPYFTGSNPHRNTKNKSELHNQTHHSHNQQKFQSPSKMILQLTKSLKTSQPRYIYKLKTKKNNSIVYYQRQQSSKTTNENRRGKIRFSTHLIPTPCQVQPSQYQLPSKPKDRNDIKKIKRDLMNSFELKTQNQIELEKQYKSYNSTSTRQVIPKSDRRQMLNTFYQTGMFRGSTIIRTKKKQKIEITSPEQSKKASRKMTKRQQAERPYSGSLSQSRQFQLIQNMIQLEKM